MHDRRDRLGYVGLPLIDAFVNAGYRCLGFDIDPQKVDLLNRGKVTSSTSTVTEFRNGWL